MTKISIFNNKGGLAKTASVLNIAYNLHLKGYKTLAVDCDEQRNLYETLYQTKSNEIRQQARKNLFITTYAEYEKATSNSKTYDYIIFDLPPSISEQTRKIIESSDFVFAPIKIGAFEIKGVTKVTDIVNKGRVKLGGVFITLLDKREKGTISETKETLRLYLGKMLMESEIPTSTAIPKSLFVGLPVGEYFQSLPKSIQKKNTIVKAYERLTEEIIERTV